MASFHGIHLFKCLGNDVQLGTDIDVFHMDMADNSLLTNEKERAFSRAVRTEDAEFFRHGAMGPEIGQHRKP